MFGDTKDLLLIPFRCHDGILFMFFKKNPYLLEIDTKIFTDESMQ